MKTKRISMYLSYQLGGSYGLRRQIVTNILYQCEMRDRHPACIMAAYQGTNCLSE